MRDVNLTWYVGLDAEATRIGDVLWNGEELDEAAQRRVVGLFRLTFRDPGVALDKVQGEPVFLILAMDKDKILRIKPQNLLTGLPGRASGDRDVSALVRIPVGVVVERRKAMSQWADFVWQPVAVLPDAPDTAPWTVLRHDGDRTSFYAGPAIVELHTTETSHYRDNLAGDALLWVVLRPTRSRRSGLPDRVCHRGPVRG